ncbi:hypothetical protein THAOC_30470 [Thalassiosira oceanica]|uniref:Uncharacterized protein n=1 Tax=Thalassiosira oceanica TaxID=159749 RepID=K0RNN3_THAOC|nr:hypothetical protein THAOC_30470 [Thalassiosira oceanica]|eukprot:EJK50526.1 hypothetical protein THAOC_30470 [Thalassiosira oceanica]
MRLPTTTLSLLAIAPAAAAAEERTYTDDLGVVHTTTKEKPTIVTFAHTAVSAFDYGLGTDQLIGTYGEYLVEGSTFDFDMPEQASAYSADPEPDDIARLLETTNLSPDCERTPGYCTSFDVAGLVELDPDFLVVHGVSLPSISADNLLARPSTRNLTPNLTPRFEPTNDPRTNLGPMPVRRQTVGLLELHRDPAEFPRGKDHIQRRQPRGGQLHGDRELLREVHDRHGRAIQGARGVPRGRGGSRAAGRLRRPLRGGERVQRSHGNGAREGDQDHGVVRRSHQRILREPGQRRECSRYFWIVSFSETVVSPATPIGTQMVLRMFEELGMPILHIGACANCSLSYFWETIPVESYFKSCEVNTTDFSVCNEDPLYPIDVWLYDHRVRGTVNNEDFGVVFPDKAILAGQFVEWPIGGRKITPAHAAEILRSVGPAVAGFDRIHGETDCVPDIDVSGLDHRQSGEGVKGAGAGQYACYNSGECPRLLRAFLAHCSNSILRMTRIIERLDLPQIPRSALDSPALTFDDRSYLRLHWSAKIARKIKKRKRLHRKSHGRIGFHALNQQISRAWGNVEEEVRIFCENLAATEAAKYRMVMPREVKELSTPGINSEPTKSNLDNSCIARSLPPPLCFAARSVRSVSSESSIEATAMTGACPAISNSFNSDKGLQGSSSHVSRLRSSPSVIEVDMDDEEILSLWNSSDDVDDEETRGTQESFYLPSHIDPVNITSSSVQALKRVDEEAVGPNVFSFCPGNDKMSLYLDQSQHKLSNAPKRNSIAARQA